jgi:hypothetical protein
MCSPQPLPFLDSAPPTLIAYPIFNTFTLIVHNDIRYGPHPYPLPRLHPKQKSKFVVASHLILINQTHRLPPLSTLSHSTPPQSLRTSKDAVQLIDDECLLVSPDTGDADANRVDDLEDLCKKFVCKVDLPKSMSPNSPCSTSYADQCI